MLTTDQSPLREFLNEYAALTNKYEALLSKTSEINAQISLKLNVLPTVESVNTCINVRLALLPTLESVNNINVRLGGLPTLNDINNSVTALIVETNAAHKSSISTLDKHVGKMLGRFNWLIGIITTATIIGLIALGYVNSILNIAKVKMG